MIGADCAGRIHAHMNEVRKGGSEALSVWLAADSPATPEIMEWGETAGLSFAGLLPFYFQGRDAVLLQWVGVPMDMDAVKVHDRHGRMLFDYVRDCLGY